MNTLNNTTNLNINEDLGAALGNMAIAVPQQQHPLQLNDTMGQTAIAVPQQQHQQLAMTGHQQGHEQGHQQLALFQQPTVQYTPTDHQAATAGLNTRVSYRTTYPLLDVRDTKMRDKFAKELERNDRLRTTSNNRLNTFRLQINNINGTWQGAISSPSGVSMDIIHKGFQGQRELVEFTQNIIHPQAGIESVQNFMNHFNELSTLTHQLMEEGLKNMSLDAQRRRIFVEIREYLVEQQKASSARILALEQTATDSDGFFSEMFLGAQ